MDRSSCCIMFKNILGNKKDINQEKIDSCYFKIDDKKIEIFNDWLDMCDQNKIYNIYELVKRYDIYIINLDDFNKNYGDIKSYFNSRCKSIMINNKLHQEEQIFLLSYHIVEYIKNDYVSTLIKSKEDYDETIYGEALYLKNIIINNKNKVKIYKS